MADFLKLLKVLGAVAFVALAGITLGWLGTRGPKTAPPTASGVPTITSGTRPGGIISSHPISAVSTGDVGVSSGQQKTESVPPPVLNLITNWEDRLDDILAGEQPEKAKARSLLALFPQLPSDGQLEVAQHLANLVEDEDYPPLGRFLTNSALPEDVLDVLFSDLLNRPNSTKISTLLDVAREPKNPKAAEAKDLLELFLEEDYGNDWVRWQKKAAEWLKDNPD
jgi:hypothetical protein